MFRVWGEFMRRMLIVGLVGLLVGCVSESAESSKTTPVEPYKKRIAKRAYGNSHAYKISRLQ